MCTFFLARVTERGDFTVSDVLSMFIQSFNFDPRQESNLSLWYSLVLRAILPSVLQFDEFSDRNFILNDTRQGITSSYTVRDNGTSEIN